MTTGTRTAERTARGGEDPYPTRAVDTTVLMRRGEPTAWPGEKPLPQPQLAASEVETYDRNGYLTIDQIITPGELADLRDELERLRNDPETRSDERTVREPESDEVRSIFEIHRISPLMADLVADPRLADRARQLLGSDVYVHQSRANLKPGFSGSGFSWHSDFETWHAEDGMPAMRAVSISLALTDNHVHNGALMIMPGSHRTFVACPGETPEGHYRTSLRNQQVGTPSREALTELADQHGIDVITGPAGSATMFDSNCMHGSSNNITPYPRSNLFIVYNSVDNALVDPYSAPSPRPGFIASRDPKPVPRR